MKIIHLIGNSGSGKTYLAVRMITLLKEKLNFNVAVIKNIHEHEVDQPGKDSYKYTEAGAIFSITKNVHDENTIFLKKPIELEQIINWMTKSPFKIDLVLIEGFKDLDYPSILCVRNLDEIEDKWDDNVKIITGNICTKKEIIDQYKQIPILDIDVNFSGFINILKIQE